MLRAVERRLLRDGHRLRHKVVDGLLHRGGGGGCEHLATAPGRRRWTAERLEACWKLSTSKTKHAGTTLHRERDVARRCMGGAKRKGGDKGRAKRHAKTARRDKWHTALRSVLSVLEWSDADPAELRSALVQLPEVMVMLATVGEPLSGEEMSKLISGLERCWSRDLAPPELRAAAWTALQEASLAESSLCEAALARDVHTLALRELEAAARASACNPGVLADGEAGDLAAGVPQLGFLWNACEAVPQAAAALGSRPCVEAIGLWAGSRAEPAAINALSLLLVLADGAIDEPDAAAHARAVAASLLAELEPFPPPPEPFPLGGGDRPAVEEPPRAGDTPMVVAGSSSVGGSADTAAPGRTAATARPTRRRVLAAALLLALPLACEAAQIGGGLGAAAGGEAEIAASAAVISAFGVLRAGACAPVTDDSVPLEARLLALEALCNALAVAAEAVDGVAQAEVGARAEAAAGSLPQAAGGAADALAVRLAVRAAEEEEEEAGRREQAARMCASVLLCLPPSVLLLPDAAAGGSTEGLLELLASVLARAAARAEPGKKRKGKGKAQPAGGGIAAGPGNPAAETETGDGEGEADDELLERLLHCAGSAMALCGSTGGATPPLLTAAWDALLTPMGRVQHLRQGVQEGLLSLLSVLAMASAAVPVSAWPTSPADTSPAVSAPTAALEPHSAAAPPTPLHRVARIAFAAAQCVRQVADASRPAALSLAGHVLAFAGPAAAGASGDVSWDASGDASVRAIESELSDWVSSTDVAAAVEAAAALTTAGRGAGLVRAALPRLRAAVDTDGQALVPMTAEARQQAAELLAGIERELGEAQWGGSA